MAMAVAMAFALCGAAAPAQAAERPPPKRPNIVLIVADDLGFNDLSVQGNPLVRTPHIDSLARDGARFEAAYTADAVCAPSRAALMTGRNPQRFGFEFLLDATETLRAAGYAPAPQPGLPARPPVPADVNGLPAGELTLGDLLRRQGYRTGAIGKWDLGAHANFEPAHRGFDETARILGGASFYAPEDDPAVVDVRLPWQPADAALRRVLNRQAGADRVAPGRYMTDALADEAVGFIDRNARRPFFLYLAFSAPHTPLQAPRRIYDRLGDIRDERTRAYYAMVESLDEAVGRVLAELKAKGLERDTIVVFTSDNGAAPYVRIPVANLPFRGSKNTYFEGGVRAPFFVRWPARIRAGALVGGIASSLDFAPTFVAAAGGTLPTDRAYDGLDLLPALEGAAAAPLRERALFWRKDEYRAVRVGRWKLQTSRYPEAVWLFDLENDPTERVNLALEHPDKVAELKARLAAAEAGWRAPLWPVQSRARIEVDGYVPGGGERDYVTWAN